MSRFTDRRRIQRWGVLWLLVPLLLVAAKEAGPAAVAIGGFSFTAWGLVYLTGSWWHRFRRRSLAGRVKS